MNVLFSEVAVEKIRCIKGQTGDNWVDKKVFSWRRGGAIVSFLILHSLAG